MHFKKLPPAICWRSNIPKAEDIPSKDFWRPGSHGRNRCPFFRWAITPLESAVLSHWVTRAEIYGGRVGSLHGEGAWLLFCAFLPGCLLALQAAWSTCFKNTQNYPKSLWPNRVVWNKREPKARRSNAS